MRRHTLPVVGLLILAACSPAPEGATTTVGATSTSTPTTSTTTTTTAPTTTTTTLPPTTTTTLLEGNWAAQPLVVMADWGGMALGWWDGSQWVQVEEGTSLPVVGGEDYQIALLGSEDGRTTGGAQIFSCVDGYGEFPGIALDDQEALYTSIDGGQGDRSGISGVAISAPWDLTPNHVGPGEAHPDLEAMAWTLLSDRGFETDSAPIAQAVDADLDGDGAIETIVVVEDTELGNEMSGVYSLVFLVGPGLNGPMVVDESVIPEDESGYPTSLRVGAVADLSGDGSMEVVIDGESWEDSGKAVFEMVGDEFLRRMSVGCGA